MRISVKDIEAAEIAYDHFVSDTEGGANEEFEKQLEKVRNLLLKLKKAHRKQVQENA